NGGNTGVTGLYEITAFDDTGKDLGIMSTSSAGVTISEVKPYIVTMNTNNGSAAISAFVEEGSTLTETTPLYAGHLFKGWYTDAECTVAYDFSQEVASDLNLYAKWVSIDHVVARTVTVLGEEQESPSKHTEATSRLSVSEGATKVYIEYSLGNDDDAGHSFMFDKSAGTMVAAYTQESIWNGSERFAQENSHIWAANNPGLYTADYTVVFDLVTNQVVWYRGTVVILEATGSAFADATSFGFFTYTAGSGSFEVKIYDDMGKDLGVRSMEGPSTLSIEFPKATFDANYEGGEDKVVDVTGATITAPTDVVRPAYKLVGWYTDAECTTAYDFTKEVAGDITVYAKWEEIPQVVVTFNANGGTDVDPQTINIDTAATAPVTTKTGYDVEGWYLDAELTQKFDFDTLVTEDITLYAKWTVKILTVSFNTNGGSTVDDASVEYNQALVAPTAPTKAGGYDFVGWYVDEALEVAYDFDSIVTEGFTLYAKWIEATYVVEFNVDGGSEVASQEFNYGESLAAPTAPTKAGYAFMGWYFDANFARKANFPISVENDITLYAKWEVVVFTVSFDTDGGTEIEAVQVNSGSTIAEPTVPVKDGFIFDGWYVEVNGTEAFDFNTAINADITLYARWKAAPVDNDTNLMDKVMSKLGCAGSLAQDSFMIIGTMLAVAGVIVIKALKKKEN
ncbi:MAG: hypothetical protein E7348_06765, partial [Clostridiales bacterium]|nr:hypothetical protein [Clostridiales bacterium]